ncbi:MAG TPA: amidohydrolase family protein [Candidatus Limnocylindrales bacterium]|jgi:L-fuconolactonase|nr:amidohydrolase family protein [Candidatus Limnocylindrales bacterium]
MSDPALVDAHHHFWDPAHADYPWLTPDLGAIDRAFGPDDLAPSLEESGIGRTIVVQARASLDETRALLAIAAASPFVAGVVGWVDLTDPAVGTTLDALRADPGGERLIGVRHQVHDEPDPEWLLRPDVRRGLRAVGDAGLAYDLLVRPRELPAALEVVRALPELRFVVDHLAKPPIREGALEPWAKLISAFGPLEHVSCKISGLVTEADWKAWRIEDLAPFVRHAIDVFTPARLMFGSDWPVCLLAAPYDRVVGAARTLTAGLSGAERRLVFGATASRVYRLDTSD